LPVVSTFDPDSLIARKKLGLVAKDVVEMGAAINALLSSPARYQEVSQNGRAYFAAHHQADVVLPRFEQLFLETLDRTRGSRHPE
jgi:glycosyltransferase involved in cell wall biosynthesis